MEKMTNAKALGFVLELAEVKANQEVFQKLEKMLVQVNKKNSSVDKDGKKTLTVDQKKNEGIKEEIVNALAELDEPIQIKALQEMEKFTAYSNQKLSALLRQLVESGLVERVVDKKITKFKIAQ